MRLIRMSERSRYWGKSCLHCHKNIAKGRAAFVSTYYIIGDQPWVRTHSTRGRLETVGLISFDADYKAPEEIQVRIAYHRACIEKILRHGPIDREIEIADWEAYRSSLLDQYGIEEDDNEVLRSVPES